MAGLSGGSRPFGWFQGGSSSGPLSSRDVAPSRSGFPVKAQSILTRTTQGQHSHWDVSLKQPLVVYPSMIKVPAQQAPVLRAPEVRVATSRGGIKVVSVQPAVASPVASLGIFIPSGPRNETHHTRGASHFLKHMAFKGNKLRSGLEFVREVEQAGAQVQVQEDRESTAVLSSFLHADLPYVLSALSGVLVPSLPEWEVRDTLPDVEREAQAAAADPATQLVEALHREAFRGSGLAHSLHAPLWNLHHLSHEALAAFVAEHYRLDETVLVGVGLEHDALLAHANALLEFAALERPAPAHPRPRPAPASYVGGEARLEGDGPNQVAVAFEGAARGAKDLAGFQVLQALLGTAAVGVGRPSGLHTRLGAVLRKHAGRVSEGAAFNFSYSDAGLFGAHLSGEADAAELVAALQSAFSALRNASEEEVGAAKKRAKLRLLAEVEGHAGQLAWVGAGALGGAAEADATGALERIDALSTQEVLQLATRVAASKPTLAAYGDVGKL